MSASFSSICCTARRAQDPRSILSTITSIAPYLSIDDRLSMTDAAAWLWDFRNAEVQTEEIPVTGTTTSTGANVLVPSVDIPKFIDGIS